MAVPAITAHANRLRRVLAIRIREHLRRTERAFRTTDHDLPPE